MDKKKTVFVWIRHAEKQYANNRGPSGHPKHDSPIQEHTQEDIFEKTRQLYKKYGLPDTILFSPFLRTRQTKDMMFQQLQELEPEKVYDIDIQPDITIAEYLGFQKPFGDRADVEEDTLVYFSKPILLGEPLKNLNYRVRQHLQKLDCFNISNPRVVWIITHRIILYNIYYNLSKKLNQENNLPKNIPSLSHISFEYDYGKNKYDLQYDLKEETFFHSM